MLLALRVPSVWNGKAYKKKLKNWVYFGPNPKGCSNYLVEFPITTIIGSLQDPRAKPRGAPAHYRRIGLLPRRVPG